MKCICGSGENKKGKGHKEGDPGNAPMEYCASREWDGCRSPVLEQGSCWSTRGSAPMEVVYLVGMESNHSNKPSAHASWAGGHVPSDGDIPNGEHHGCKKGGGDVSEMPLSYRAGACPAAPRVQCWCGCGSGLFPAHSKGSSEHLVSSGDPSAGS